MWNRIVSLALFFGLTAWSFAQVDTTCRVMDTSGGKATGGGFTLVSSVGQLSGQTFTGAGDTTLFTGFLGCFLLRPDLDTDENGLPDELDPDNDGDSLDDGNEIAGGQFDPPTPTDPNKADTDGDGVPDGDEAAHQTDPSDENMFLEITDLEPLPGDLWRITWRARAGVNYGTHWYTDYNTDFPGTDTGVSKTAAGGSAPWFETSATADVPKPADGLIQFYVKPR